MRGICFKCGLTKKVLFYESVDGWKKHICNECLENMKPSSLTGRKS